MTDIWSVEPVVAVVCPEESCPRPGTRVRVGVVDGRPTLEWEGARVWAWPDRGPDGRPVMRTGAVGTVRNVRPVRPSPRREAWLVELEPGASLGCCESPSS